MGLVYAARDARLGRRVALKFLPPQWSHDETAKERFMREAQAASATDHPNICTIHDIGITDDGQLFIVMAQYDGETLKARLEAGALGVDEAIDIAAQVAEGLAKAHAQGVIHRDIKPGNLMLTEDGVKILDFGLAKFADARFKLTLEGSTIGTIAYMSPEQVRGDEADARSDVWAVGAVLYEMLAGGVPFKGGYPEAIAHAITRETPAPLRASRPEVSEALEQVVFRALHKDPAVRFQSARDLARALRRLQGRTIPVDLRTEPLPRIDAGSALRRRRSARRPAAVLAALAALIVGAGWWILAPVERIPVAVAPVGNQTGYAELDPYRMALTQELTAHLTDSRVVRVLSYERLLQIVRRFRQSGGDVSSREAMQALATHSGARLLVVPTVVYEGGAWRARAEVRDPTTATTQATVEAGPVVSSLLKDAIYALMPELAAAVQGHLAETGPVRSRLATTVRRAIGGGASVPSVRMRSMDAAAAFAAGLDAYDQQEYASALQFFTTASQQDARNPLLFAWRSRAARIMRRDDEAADAGQQALQHLSDSTAPEDRLFIEAIAAEARRDARTAESRLRDLSNRLADDPRWVIELAAFQDRQANTRQAWGGAVGSYHQALAMDAALVRPHLELCRLYNLLQEPVSAKEHGQQALGRYRQLGLRDGEAQALFCLTSVLGTDSEQARQEAKTYAENALSILTELQFTYNLPRAHYYIGLAASDQGRFPEAIAAWERAAEAARTAGNIVLEPLVLMNLGLAHERLGNSARAASYYAQSATLYERLGDERRAAQLQANSGALRILYGEQPDEALRDVQNALVVHRKLGDALFEVVCLLAIGAYHHYAAAYEEAERHINRALALARQRNLDQWVSTATLDLAQVRFERGDYMAARRLLQEAATDGSSRAGARARTLLGSVRTKLGDFAGAAADFTAASADLDAREDIGWTRPALDWAMGQLAYESGRIADARRHFQDAASRRTDAFAEGATVLARANLGLLDAQTGRTAAGRRAIAASLAQALRMQRVALEAACRILLARMYLLERHTDQALATLDALSAERLRALGPELRAQAHFWRGRSLETRGDREAANMEFAIARTVVMEVQESLPAPERSSFAARREIRELTGK